MVGILNFDSYVLLSLFPSRRPEGSGFTVMVDSPTRLTLPDLPVGRPALVSAIGGDPRFVRRCYSLGLHVGSQLTVTKHRRGGLVVAVGTGRVALDRDMAARIEVEAPH